MPVDGPEYVRALQRRYREENRERIKAYKTAYYAEHRQEHADYERERAARKRAERETQQRVREQKARKREYAKNYYREHRDRILAANNAAHQRRKNADPVAERERKREATRKWRANNAERENAKLREKYAQDPRAKREAAARYYETHAEEIKARRREYYGQNREAQLEAQRRWRARESRRIRLGLPAARLHPSSPDAKRLHAEDADFFFAREWSASDLARIHQERLAAWERDCFRARAAAYLRDAPEVRDRIRHSVDNAPAGARRPEHESTARQRARDAENDRLDEIARRINQQLRLRPPPRHPHHLDPAPHIPIPTIPTWRGPGR